MAELRIYQPRGFKSLEALYEITVGEKGDRWNPEVLPTIEWIEVHANGQALDVNASAVFIENFGEHWEWDILYGYGYLL